MKQNTMVNRMQIGQAVTGQQFVGCQRPLICHCKLSEVQIPCHGGAYRLIAKVHQDYYHQCY